MKKIAVPAILGVTILLGAIIATMPVQQASTVHTTLSANILNADRHFSVTVIGNTTAAVGTHVYLNLTEYAAGAYDEAFISIQAQNPRVQAGEGCLVLAEQGGTTFNSDEAGEAILQVEGVTLGVNNTGNRVSPYPAVDLVDQLRVIINTTASSPTAAAGIPTCVIVIQLEDTDV